MWHGVACSGIYLGCLFPSWRSLCLLYVHLHRGACQRTLHVLTARCVESCRARRCACMQYASCSLCRACVRVAAQAVGLQCLAAAHEFSGHGATHLRHLPGAGLAHGAGGHNSRCVKVAHRWCLQCSCLACLCVCSSLWNHAGVPRCLPGQLARGLTSCAA